MLPLAGLGNKLLHHHIEHGPRGEGEQIGEKGGDVVNEVNTKMDLSEFFYELYLEMLEDSLNSQDPILYRMIFPFEIAQDEFESNDIEQVKCVLEISDNILHEQKNKILGL